jgi:hypothetical protein
MNMPKHMARKAISLRGSISSLGDIACADDMTGFLTAARR